jgi:DNA-binding transcriptional MerR regulator
MQYSIGELAKLARVSVRTLHHYDEVGLLSPSERTAAGYRKYSSADAERLHRILVYRELGFDLAGIAVILDDRMVDAVEQLQRQHALLSERIGRLQQMRKGVETMMDAKQSGLNLKPDELREVFGDFDPAEHQPEAERRWGGTEAYRESQRRASQYGKAEWLQLKAEAEQINARLAATLTSGVPASAPEAMDLAEQHRQHISRWFYECTYAIHRGLGEMYVADPRFSAHYEDAAPGLSAYLRDAINANAARAEKPRGNEPRN